VAKALTSKPGAATGLAPSVQPLAGAMWTVGISRLLGSGRDRCRAVEPRQVSSGGVPLSPHPRRDFVADDWEDMTVDDKLDHLLSRLDTLEGRLEEVLRHLSELGDAVEAIELKLRQ
jgi:hypothetical protein